MPDALQRHMAIFIPDLRGGGAERVMVTLANRFAARGHRVDLVLGCASGEYRAEVSPEVKVVDLRSGRMLASILPLARYLRRERPEVMLSALNHVNVVAILARKLAGVRMRLVISERNSLTSLGEGRAGKVLHRLMAWFYPSADAVIAVTQAGAKELMVAFGLPKASVFAIPNPVDIEQVQALSAEPLTHPWFDTGSPPFILAVGRLSPQKDFGILIQAFAKLRSQHPVRLVILGEGSLRKELERQVSELGLTGDVYMPGFQDNPFNWMAASSLFVLSSRFEGFPNVLVQAMACGARIVSTDCPTGPEEILEGGRWGRLVQVGNVGELTMAMAKALEEPVVTSPHLRVSSYEATGIIGRYEEVLGMKATFNAKSIP